MESIILSMEGDVGSWELVLNSVERKNFYMNRVIEKIKEQENC